MNTVKRFYELTTILWLTGSHVPVWEEWLIPCQLLFLQQLFSLVYRWMKVFEHITTIGKM